MVSTVRFLGDSGTPDRRFRGNDWETVGVTRNLRGDVAQARVSRGR